MDDNINSAILENTDSSWPRRYSKILLFAIILLASLLRFINLSHTPPGLNQDEAANAWSAYCLLKTGQDYYYRTSWPIYYVRNVGGNSSTLYVYLMMPFQAIGGMNVYTTRLPAAVGGVLAVWLTFFVGKRLFGTTTALAAAALLAIDPWHLQHSRNGLESSISPLCSILPLALLLWAGLLSSDKNKNPSPKPLIAALAGLLAGIGCYGHWEVRLFVPTFLFLAVLFTLPNWWKILKTRKGALAVALFSLGFAVTWGALIWQHIFHPEGISRHALFQKEWVGSVPLFTALENMAVRYIQHFEPSFLFIDSDQNPMFSPPGMGKFYWYMAPLMLAGLIWLVRQFKSSPSARIIIAFLLAYPIGDCLVWGCGLQILRSAPGVCGLILLSAVGAVDTAHWLWTKNRNTAIVIAVIFSIVVIGMNLKYLHYFYGKYSREPNVYHSFHTDLIEACDWLKPRFDDFDAIYVTTLGINMPYVVSAVALNYDPNRWFSEPIEIAPPSEYDSYLRYGKMHFIYDYTNFSILELQKKIAPGRLLLILRPDEYSVLAKMEKIENPVQYVIHRISGPENSDVLWLCRF